MQDNLSTNSTNSTNSTYSTYSTNKYKYNYNRPARLIDPKIYNKYRQNNMQQMMIMQNNFNFQRKPTMQHYIPDLPDISGITTYYITKLTIIQKIKIFIFRLFRIY